MKKYFYLALLAALGLPLAWVGIDHIDAQSPRRAGDSMLSFFQPGPGGPGRGGPGGGRGDGPRDGRRPPPPGPDGRPPRGPEGGPPHPRPGSGGKLEMEYLKQIDPEMAKLIEQDHELDRETYKLAERYQRALPAQKNQLRVEIVKIVNEHFEVRQQRRELELKRLEDELKRLQESIDARNSAKEKIVQQRIAEVLQQGDLRF